ncbi:MAG TPA: hypothetical protein DCF49_00855, partial [Lachnospiraceae bacterium]|nr:hypothetical protein [Lachnospiraceae bacterium]
NHLEYKIVKAGSEESFMQTDLIVLYVLEGEMTVRYYGDRIRMSKDDILLINSGMEYGISGARDCIYGTASFSIGIISQIMDKKSLMLYVDSARDVLHTYQDLRDILQEMTAEYILHAHRTRAAMDSLMLRLLDCLIEHYQLGQGQIEADENDTDARMRQMMQYIINHIHDEISLSDLANEMFVSTSTLSRIFKKNTGMYFADYVMRLRVRTSLGLLRTSEQNLTQIAMNCGFSTSAAFNRSFKKVTGMMPSEYRKQYQISVESEEQEARDELEIREELRKKGYQFSRQDNRKEYDLSLSELSPASYKQVWSRCINVGSFFELSRANTQFHVVYLQEHLHYKYIRLWNIFSEKMMVSDGRTIGHYNFDLINQVLDFLVVHHLKPFLDLGRRPDTAIRSQGNEIYYKEEHIHFVSKEIWEDLLRAFLDNVITRYGFEEVSSWVFELTRDFHTRENGIYKDDQYDYFEVWKIAYRAVREKVPGAMIGGISTVIGTDRDFAEQFFRRCVKEDYKPDFVSFFLYPYETVSGPQGETVQRVATANIRFEREEVLQMRALMKDVGLQDRKLFLSEWNNSIGNRNYLNDSCFRAAYLTAKTVELWGMTDMTAVMGGTDWVSSYIDTNKVLNGGVGLLTKDTIAKPAFYAFSFLEHMGTQFLSKGDHYLLTKKGNGDLYLLCFNFRWYQQTGRVNGDEIDLDCIRQIRYDDERKLEMTFMLRGMTERGEYTVKKRSLNKQSGSVLDEWGRLGYETKLNREDVKYLQAISVPRIEMERVITDAYRDLEIKVKLEPQEVVLLHIYKV